MLKFDELPIVDMQATGRNIRKLRRNAHIRVVQLQDAFGFTSTNAIYKWESGQSFPSLENLVALSEILGCTIEDILVINKRPV